MKGRKIVSLVSCCLLVCAVSSLFAGAGQKAKAEPWKLIKNKNGVKVFARSVKGSKYRELLARGTVDVPFEVGLELVKDCDCYHKWYGMCEKLYVIKKINDHEYIMYFVLDMPLVTDRDLVVRVKSEWDMEKRCGSVTLTSIDSDYKKNSGYVRMPKLTGGFTFREINDGKLEVSYRVHADLGGSVPAWMVNIAAKKHPYETAVGAKKYVNQEKFYRRAETLYGKKFARRK